MSNLNKSDISRAVAKNLNVSLAHANEYTDAVLNALIESVVTSDRVVITNFGTFYRVLTRAHTRRNPQTGEHVQMPEKYRVRLRAHKRFTDLANGVANVPERGSPIKKAPKTTK